MGRALLQLLTSEKSILINRVAISYAFKNANLSQILFEHGRQSTLPKIETLIELAMERESPQSKYSFSGMAESFIGLVMGDLQIRCLLGVAVTPDAEEVDMRVRCAAEQFIRLLKA